MMDTDAVRWFFVPGVHRRADLAVLANRPRPAGKICEKIYLDVHVVNTDFCEWLAASLDDAVPLWPWPFTAPGIRLIRLTRHVYA